LETRYVLNRMKGHPASIQIGLLLLLDLLVTLVIGITGALAAYFMDLFVRTLRDPGVDVSCAGCWARYCGGFVKL